jgi:hypothetical protein
VVGNTKVVVVARLLGVVMEGVDVRTRVEEAAVVDVDTEVGTADAVAFFAIALDAP